MQALYESLTQLIRGFGFAILLIGLPLLTFEMFHYLRQEKNK